MNRRQINLLILFFAGLSVMVVFLRLLGLGRADDVLVVWPASGVEIALLLPQWQRVPGQRKVLLMAGAGGVFVGGLAAGLPALLAAQIGVFTVIDMFVGCWLMSRPGHVINCFDDLKLMPKLARFLATAVCAPVLTGLLSAAPLSAFLHQPFLQTAVTNALANSLGITLVFPSVLAIAEGKYRETWRLLTSPTRVTGALAVFAGVASFTFWQNFGPFLFFVFPPLILVLLLAGLEGAMLCSVALTAVGWFATRTGHGPLWLMQGATLNQRLIVLQIFIWVFLATALPVGALFDGRRRAERKADEARSIYETLLDNASDMIVLSSVDGTGRYVSPAVEKLTGWTPEEYLAMNRLDTLHPDDRETGRTFLKSMAEGKVDQSLRYRTLRKDGSWRWVETTIRAFRNAEGAVGGYVGTVRDISQLKRTEENWEEERVRFTDDQQRLEELASTDALTGLLNRRGFDEELRERDRHGVKTQISVLMMDVDYFKLYNDSLGHPAGDECLRQLARVFAKRVARQGDLVARVGGEEFAVILLGADEAGGRKVAEELMENVRGLRLPHPASPLGVVTLSIGVATSCAEQTLEIGILMGLADAALYASKQNGRNQVSVNRFDFHLETPVSDAVDEVRVLDSVKGEVGYRR